MNFVDKVLIWFSLAISVVALVVAILVHNTATNLPANSEIQEWPAGYFAIVGDGERENEYIPGGTLVANKNSFTVDGLAYEMTEPFVLMTLYNTRISLRLDDNKPIKANQVILFLNGSKPEVCWVVTVDADWNCVRFGSGLKQVTITP
jgi:hypothetical protein